MPNAHELIARLRSRLSQDGMTETEFSIAVTEILAATSEELSGADALIMSREIRDLEHAWRDSWQLPAD